MSDIIFFFSDLDEMEVESIQLNELMSQDQAAYEAWLSNEYNSSNEQQDEQDEQF